jgi:hypothetical protein
MVRAYIGAIMLIGGIAAFIEAHANHPVPAFTPPAEFRWGRPDMEPSPASGLPPTAYDLLRIGAWALVILGGLTIAFGVVGYLATLRRPTLVSDSSSS